MSKRWYRIFRVAVVVLAVVASLAAVGAIYESSASVRDAQVVPPGRLVDAGAHRLHLHREGVGSPTVVLEAGGGNSSVTFRPLMRVLAETTRVCAYDRAGFGYSGPLHAERDAERVAAELLELLTRAGEDGPYVVAAHSMGGLYALTLASERPDEVAGLVLVDVIPPTYLVPLPEPLASSIGLFDVCRSGLARIGVWRLLGSLGALPLDQVALAPEADRREARAHALRTDFCSTAYAEAVTLERSARSVLGFAPEAPTVVMVAGARSADAWPADDARWRAAQNDLAARSTHGRVVVVDGDHYLPLEPGEGEVGARPDDVVAGCSSAPRLDGRRCRSWSSRRTWHC